MVDLGPIVSGRYSHDLLLHDSDDGVMAATQAFVEQGLASGGRVLVHGTEERLAMLRESLGSHCRLSYTLDSDLYLSPSGTLFAYDRALAADPTELWVTGTVPFGGDAASHPAWARYESLVNEMLGGYAFHALCTYDTRSLPARTIAAAKATHPGRNIGGERSGSCDYLTPVAFLADPLAGIPGPPSARPAITTTLYSPDDLARTRHLVASGAETASAVARDKITDFTAAMNEVLTNALTHGAAPVHLAVWVDTAKLTCQVIDTGRGISDTLSGYHHPTASGPMGLWVARQLCENITVSNDPGGGCSVMLATG